MAFSNRNSLVGHIRPPPVCQAGLPSVRVDGGQTQPAKHLQGVVMAPAVSAWGVMKDGCGDQKVPWLVRVIAPLPNRN